jgi:hypothetical protein
MGLDITAYSKLKRIKRGGKIRFYGNDAYPDRAKPIVTDDAALYVCQGEELDFRAGSYSGYNLWREQLSRMATGLAPEIIWRDEERYKDTPFFLLINFCEGTIGTEAAKVLAQQFADWQAKADQHEDTWFREKYAQWRKAFELASDNGAVEFG